MNTNKRQTLRKKTAEIKDKLKRINPSLYNRTTGKRLLPGGKPKLTKSQMLLQAQGKDLKGGPITSSTKKRSFAGGPKPKKFNLGGEAATSVGRGTVVKSQREAQRKKLDDMMKRLYGPKIKPKPKPKKPLKAELGDKMKPRLKKKPLKKRLKEAQKKR